MRGVPWGWRVSRAPDGALVVRPSAWRDRILGCLLAGGALTALLFVPPFSNGVRGEQPVYAWQPLVLVPIIGFWLIAGVAALVVREEWRVGPNSLCVRSRGLELRAREQTFRDAVLEIRWYLDSDASWTRDLVVRQGDRELMLRCPQKEQPAAAAFLAQQTGWAQPEVPPDPKPTAAERRSMNLAVLGVLLFVLIGGGLIALLGWAAAWLGARLS